MRRRIKNSLIQLPFLWRAIGFVWEAAKGWMLAWLALLIVQGLLPVVSVYLTRFLVNQLVSATSSGLSWETLQSVLLPAILIALVMLLTAVLGSLTSWIRTAQAERVQDYMSALIHEKSYTVDLAFYDSPDFFDHLHRARADAGYRPVALLEGIGSLIQNGITMISMAIVLLQFGAWVPAALLVSSIPVFYVVLRYRERLYHWRLKNTPAERRTWYYEWLLTERENAAEIRLFQLGPHFRQQFQSLRQVLRQERTDLGKDQALAELGASVMSLIVTGLSMVWMLIQTIGGVYNLGDLAFFYQAFIQGQSLSRAFLENIGEIYTNSLFLRDLFEFLSMQAEINDPNEPERLEVGLQQGILIEDVSFTYPGSERMALNNFNLQVPAGRFIAIVGPNGAGKSTLIRLLCRFYDPQVGAIYLDGIDIKQYSIENLRRSITVLFQQPVQYSATASDNIAVGDLESQPNFEQIQAAAVAAGADGTINHLPHAYDTLLGKWFEGGTDLSVGEWQRLALARAFLRQAPLIILDEPTSSMDPWAEADWLERFRRMATGKTAILITHRFTTAAHADVIYVMQDGQIVESGSHPELLERDGLYAQSWHTQMKSWSH